MVQAVFDRLIRERDGVAPNQDILDKCQSRSSDIKTILLFNINFIVACVNFNFIQLS